MVLEYEESMQDLYAFALFCHEDIPVFRRRILLYKILPPVAYFLIIAFFSFLIPTNPMPFLVIGSLVGIPVIYVFWKFIIPWVNKKSLKKLFSKICKEQKDQLAFGRRTMEFSPEGLTIKKGLAERYLKWNAVEDIVSTKEYVFIIIGVAKAYIVPKRIFSDEESIKDFTETIKKFREAA